MFNCLPTLIYDRRERETARRRFVNDIIISLRYLTYILLCSRITAETLETPFDAGGKQERFFRIGKVGKALSIP